MSTRAYLGYRGEDGDTEYGEFFDPRMAALPAHVVDALHHGPQADQVLLDFEDAKCPCGSKLVGKQNSSVCAACGTATCSPFSASHTLVFLFSSPTRWSSIANRRSIWSTGV